MGYHKVAKVGDIWDGEVKECILMDKKLLLAHIDEVFYAYENSCPHQKAPFTSTSLQAGSCVLTCPVHLWQFDISTGQGINPAKARLKSLPLKIEGEFILVELKGDTP